MSLQIFRKLIVAFCLSASGLSSNAATMTFSDIGLDYMAKTYTENGITAVGNGNLGLYNGAGGVHFDDGGTSAPSKVSFTMQSAFNAKRFDIDPVGSDFYVCYGRANCVEPSYQNVLVQGYRDGSIAASLMFNMGVSLSPYTVKLGKLFEGLSSLSISILYPERSAFSSLPGVTEIAYCSPCSHFNIDNVVLAPVPLPTSLALGASALGLLGLASRRRRNVKFKTLMKA